MAAVARRARQRACGRRAAPAAFALFAAAAVACLLARPSGAFAAGRRGAQAGRAARPWRVALGASQPPAAAREAEAPGAATLAGANATARGAAEGVAEDQRLQARDALLRAIAPLDRGFAASDQQRSEVAGLISALSALCPIADPTSRLGGKWTLIYTDAPDITGIPTGPLSELSRIGQEIDPVAGTIANVIEYRPSQLARSLPFGDRAGRDKLVQRVFTDYKVASPTSVELNIKGLGFFPERVLGLDVPEWVRLRQVGPLSAPFGRFEVLYLDEDIRIVKTGQGWTSINRRFDPDLDPA